MHNPALCNAILHRTAVKLCDIPVCTLVVSHHMRTPFYEPKHALDDLAGSQNAAAN